jgi:nucleotide-binding universal stress UspA family protein
MRVLLATDGSARANVAAELVASVDWPPDTSVEVTSVLDVPSTAFSTYPVTIPDRSPLEDALHVQLVEAQEQTADHLRSRGLTVTHRLLEGDPTTSIVARCLGAGTDLIVCGSRGHGQLRSMVLGSVSAELCETAPCPVLVARQPGITRVLLAHDGSDPALAAEQIVSRWPMFADVPIVVVSVVRVNPVWLEAMAMLTIGAGLVRYEDGLSEARSHLRTRNREVVERLIGSRRQAIGDVREGDPAAEIVTAAAEMTADLVVVGTHGHRGLDRLMLGSVARAVLLHTPASVLVVRPAPVPVDEPAAIQTSRAPAALVGAF